MDLGDDDIIPREESNSACKLGPAKEDFIRGTLLKASTSSMSADDADGADTALFSDGGSSSESNLSSAHSSMHVSDISDDGGSDSDGDGDGDGDDSPARNISDGKKRKKSHRDDFSDASSSNSDVSDSSDSEVEKKEQRQRRKKRHSDKSRVPKSKTRTKTKKSIGSDFSVSEESDLGISDDDGGDDDDDDDADEDMYNRESTQRLRKHREDGQQQKTAAEEQQSAEQTRICRAIGKVKQALTDLREGRCAPAAPLNPAARVKGGAFGLVGGGGGGGGDDDNTEAMVM